MRFATAALVALAAAVAAKEAPLNANGDTLDDAYIVKFKDSVSPADVQQHMDNLKEWNDEWPLRGEAGNGGIRPDKDQGSGSKDEDKGDSNGGSKDDSSKDTGKDDADKDHASKDDGSKDDGKDDSSGDKDQGKDQTAIEHGGSTQQEFDPFQASLEDWQKHYEAVISGISHAWFYQTINYFGYSGRFSKEVLDRIRQDDRVAYVDKDQVVGV